MRKRESEAVEGYERPSPKRLLKIVVFIVLAVGIFMLTAAPGHIRNYDVPAQSK